MKAIRTLFISLVGLVAAFGGTIISMIWGWGLEPKSWFWIISGSFFGFMIAALAQILNEEK
jgi:hypothetical protein